MKQIKAIGVGILVIVAISCVPSKQSDPYARYDKYNTPEYSIMYPQSWRLDTSGYMGTEFSIFSAQTSLLDKFIENVNLVISELPVPEMELLAYKELTESKIKQSAIDSLLLESEVVSTDSISYYKLVYKQQKGIYILKFQQYNWLKNGKAYTLTLESKENEFNLYKERGDLMMNSFILK